LIYTMALKTVVKVGGITNLSDARYCAGMGVDFLGFRVIEGQPNAIAAKTYQEIRGWIAGPQIVAEIYGISNQEALKTIIEDYQPDFFELSVDDLRIVGNCLTLPFILYLKEGETLGEMENKPAYVLMAKTGADLIKVIPETEVLAAVNNTEELDAILEKTGITGISLNGGAEIKPGLINFEDLALILEALEEEE
jgi:phosphoribosylanthranilate isomerase